MSDVSPVLAADFPAVRDFRPDENNILTVFQRLRNVNLHRSRTKTVNGVVVLTKEQEELLKAMVILNYIAT